VKWILLTAVAFMCAYQNGIGENGFSSSLKWKVKYEGFQNVYSSVIIKCLQLWLEAFALLSFRKIIRFQKYT
jgi:hypothetical protein